VEGHAIGLCKKHSGFGALGEDKGERAHQTGAKDKNRYGHLSDYDKKVKSMSQYEKMEKNLTVAAKKEELKDWTKRKFKNTRKSAEDRRAELKEELDEAKSFAESRIPHAGRLHGDTPRLQKGSDRSGRTVVYDSFLY
jgi:hypothetical protein